MNYEKKEKSFEFVKTSKKQNCSGMESSSEQEKQVQRSHNSQQEFVDLNSLSAVAFFLFLNTCISLLVLISCACLNRTSDQGLFPLSVVETAGQLLTDCAFLQLAAQIFFLLYS